MKYKERLLSPNPLNGVRLFGGYILFPLKGCIIEGILEIYFWIRSFRKRGGF